MKKIILTLTFLLLAYLLPAAARAEEAFDYASKGMDAYASKEYKKSIDYLTKAIAIESENAELYAMRGLSYWELNDYEKVIEDCSEVIELRPESETVLARAHYSRAYAMIQLKQSDKLIKASRDLKKALEHDKYLFDAYHAMAALVIAIEKYDLAIEVMNRAKEAAKEKGNKNEIALADETIGMIKEMKGESGKK